jgi:hypothetical protein
MSSFEEDMETAAWQAVGRTNPRSNDWLSGVASERRRCMRIVAEAAIGAGPERGQLVADLIRRIEGL